MISGIVGIEYRAASAVMCCRRRCVLPRKLTTPTTYIQLPRRKCVHTQVDGRIQVPVLHPESTLTPKEWRPEALGVPTLDEDVFDLARVYLPNTRMPPEPEGAAEDGMQGAEELDVDREGNSARNRLFIVGLPADATYADVTQLLSNYGECRVIMELAPSGQNRGYAHATFSRLADARAVVREHGQQPFSLKGQHIAVLYSNTVDTNNSTTYQGASRTLRIYYLPRSTTAKDIREVFGLHGSITRIRIEYDDAGNMRGLAHIDFEHAEDAAAVLAAQSRHPFVLRRRRLSITRAKTWTGRPIPTLLNKPEESNHLSYDGGLFNAHPPSYALWVGGLPLWVGEWDVLDMFKQYGLGKIRRTRIVRLPNDRSAYAHVELHLKSTADRIMARHAVRPFRLYGERGRVVHLDYAVPVVRHRPPHFTLFTPFMRGDETDIRVLFGSHAKNIRNIKFHSRPLIDPSGRAAFVEFWTTYQAMAAKDALDQKEMSDGTRLVLVFARPDPVAQRRQAAVPPPFNA